jgi:hypothetical protein
MRMKTFMLVVAIACSLTGAALAASPQVASKVSPPVPLADFLTSLNAPTTSQLPDFTPAAVPASCTLQTCLASVDCSSVDCGNGVPVPKCNVATCTGFCQCRYPNCTTCPSCCE